METLCSGIALLVLGLFSLIWSVLVLAQPARIRHLRFMYIYFLRWIPSGTEPTEGQIRAYAIGALMISVAALLAAAIALGVT